MKLTRYVCVDVGQFTLADSLKNQFFPTLILQGLDCCSDNAVSFHYVSPNQMYVLDYLVYHLRPYGIISHSQPLPDKIPFSQVVGSDKAAISMSNDIDDEAS